MEPVKTVIKGHDYVITPFGALKGQPLFFEILALGVEPVLKALSGAELSQEAQMAAIAQSGDALATAMRGLAGRPEVLRSLFENTVRDGVSLRSDGAYDAAYSANWGELLLAVKAIVEANGFLSFIGELFDN